MNSLLNILGQSKTEGCGSCGSGGGCCQSSGQASAGHGHGHHGHGHHGGCCSQSATSPSPDETRRGFMERATTLVLGSFTLTLLPLMSGDEKKEEPAETPATPPEKTATPPDPAKAASGVLYGFLIDTDKCTGAGKCLTACREENRVPEGYSRTWVERYTHFRDGRVQVDLVPETGFHGSTVAQYDPAEVAKSYFVPKLCNQCVDAPCNQVCPVHASITSPEGVELVDPDRCIGCGYCVQACPYGMRFMNPETNNADKCTWCYHRITKNEQPACVEACPTGARVFGRLDDPESELSKRLASIRTQVLKEHLGTNPKLFYTSLSDEVI